MTHNLPMIDISRNKRKAETLVELEFSETDSKINRLKDIDYQNNNYRNDNLVPPVIIF